MNELSRDSMRLTLAAELRELRRSLAELEAAEDAARQRRLQILEELDALLAAALSASAPEFACPHRCGGLQRGPHGHQQPA